MVEQSIKGKIIGFEEYDEYVVESKFGPESPFRLLTCPAAGISFIVVNPYYVKGDYTFDITDDVVQALGLDNGSTEHIAVLCIVRPDEEIVYVNLRSPLIIDTKQDRFVQAILQDESYGTAVPFAVRKRED